jgi:hypothetical protein
MRADDALPLGQYSNWVCRCDQLKAALSGNVQRDGAPTAGDLAEESTSLRAGQAVTGRCRRRPAALMAAA